MTWNLVKLSHDRVNKVIKLHILHKCYLQIKKMTAENIANSQHEVLYEVNEGEKKQIYWKENIF